MLSFACILNDHVNWVDLQLDNEKVMRDGSQIVYQNHSQSFSCNESAGQRFESENVDRQQQTPIESDSEQLVILAAAEGGIPAISSIAKR